MATLAKILGTLFPLGNWINKHEAAGHLIRKKPLKLPIESLVKEKESG